MQYETLVPAIESLWKHTATNMEMEGKSQMDAKVQAVINIYSMEEIQCDFEDTWNTKMIVTHFCGFLSRLVADSMGSSTCGHF